MTPFLAFLATITTYLVIGLALARAWFRRAEGTHGVWWEEAKR